jgi:hypothetical protein
MALGQGTTDRLFAHGVAGSEIARRESILRFVLNLRPR